MPALQHTIIACDEGLYQSFPDVAIAADGHLVVIYREADAHVASRSCLVVAHSRDGGETWSQRACLDEPMSIAASGAVWNCPRIVRQRDGGLTVICDLAVLPAGAGAALPESQRRFRTYLWRSFDSGHNWSNRRSTRIEGLVPDRLLELSDDTWLIGSHYHSLRYYDTLRQVVAITNDAGENWTVSALVAEVPGMQFCEGSVCALPHGMLVCYMRENSLRNVPVHRCYSSDGGLHWSLPHPCRFVGHRPVAGVLRSGRTLVTYRDVTVADPAAATKVGTHTATMAWVGDPFNEESGKVLTLDLDQSGVFGDYGYSGWVQLPDGRIFCAYHHRGEAQKSHVRGVWFHEADVTEPLPVAVARLYY
ncbi:MAG: sialidase family protein [Anaerolineae bacterium]